jgi:hypothetical protein
MEQTEKPTPFKRSGKKGMPPGSQIQVGIYGMNFNHMPETSWKYGYDAALGLMVCVGIGFYFYFRKKKWM